MGYVPGRQYSGLTAEIRGGILRVILPADDETVWHLRHYWLTGNRHASVTALDEGGCELRLERFHRNGRIAGLEIHITAQGSIMLAVMGNRQMACRLQRARGQKPDGRDSVVIDVGR